MVYNCNLVFVIFSLDDLVFLSRPNIHSQIGLHLFADSNEMLQITNIDSAECSGDVGKGQMACGTCALIS